MKLFRFFVLLIGIHFLACTTTQKPITNTNKEEIQGSNYTLTFTDRLRTLAGVRVQGNGASANIRIRGNNSIIADSEPLFVINGQPFDGDFAALHSFLDVGSIKKIRVIKDSGDLALYGVRGAGGVIEIIYE